MARSEKDPPVVRQRRPPATTPEARENQLIALAVNVVEDQLRNGTASSQVITHYLKLGTTREQLEKEKLSSENKLMKAKVEQLESSKGSEAMYSKALNAFRSYQGEDEVLDVDD